MALPLDPFPVPPRGVLRYAVGSGFAWEAPPLPGFSDLSLAEPASPMIRGRRIHVNLCTEGITDQDATIAAWIEQLRPQAVAARVTITLIRLRQPASGRWTMRIRSMFGEDDPNYANDPHFDDVLVPKHPGLHVHQHGRYGAESFEGCIAEELARLLDGEELWRPWPETEWELDRRGIRYTIRPDASFETSSSRLSVDHPVHE